MNETKKIGFLKQWLWSWNGFSHYRDLTKVGSGRMVGFVALLCLLYCLILYVPSFLASGIFGENFREMLNQIPEFSISNGTFSIEEPITLDEAPILVCVDDSMPYYGLADLQYFVQGNKEYTSVLVVTQTNMVIYNNYEYQEVNFSDFGSESFTFNAEFIQALVPFVVLGLVLVWILIYGFTFGMYFFYALVYSLVALIINAVAKGNDLSFGELYKTCIYAKAGPAILFAVLGMIMSLASANLPGEGWIRTILTLVILIVAILKQKKAEPPVVETQADVTESF